MPLRAVDISHVKAITDWDALCRYADILIFKATEGSPAGTAFADPAFSSRLAEARRRGKLIGAYHYVGSSVAKQVYSPTSEADWFAAHYAWRPGEVPIYDYEPIHPPADPDGWLAAAMQRLTGRGWPVPMTYMNTTAAASNPWAKVRAADTALWIARYYANDGRVPSTQPSPGSFGGYAMWQYTSNGAVPGVLGPVDVSLFYGTADQWRAIGGAGKPTPPPTPPPPTDLGDPDMRLIRTPDGTIWTVTETEVEPAADLDTANALAKAYGIPLVALSFAEKDAVYMDAAARKEARLLKQQSYILGEAPGADPSLWLFPRIVALGDAIKALQSGGVDPAVVVNGVLGGLNGTTLSVNQPS